MVNSRACRVGLLGIVLSVCVDASTTRVDRTRHSSTGLTASTHRPEPLYFCENHDVNEGNVFVGKEATYITSAGYYRRDSPGYSSFQKCVWQIRATDSLDLVNLEVIDLDLEQVPDCRNDYVVLYDGKGRLCKRLSKRLCGLLGEPRQFASTGRDMTLEFITDAKNNSRGIKVKMYAAYNIRGVFFSKTMGLLLLTFLSAGMIVMMCCFCSKCEENQVKALDRQNVSTNYCVSVVNVNRKLPPQ